MNIKQRTFTRRTNTSSTDMSTITPTSNSEEDNSNRSRWKNIIRSNSYYRRNNSTRLLVNSEKNSTSCVIQ
jgi:hypothetical protein